VSPGLPRALRPLRHRDYRLLVGSMGLSLLAGGMWAVALVWQVIALGGGPVELSVVTAAGGAGLLASALAGGVAADRLPRRAMLVVVEALRVLAAGTAGVLALTGLLLPWHLAVVAFAVGAAEAFFVPAYTCLLPDLLPAEELLAANGMEGVLRPTTQNALGPAAAAALVGAFVPGLALAAVALLHIGALLAATAMHPTPVTGPARRRSVLAELREAVRYVVGTGWLAATLAFASLYVLVLVGPIEVLLPFVVHDRTAVGAGGYALVLGAFGVGGALAALVVSSLPMPRRYLTVMLTLWGLGALPLVLIGLTDRLAVMVLACFATGATMQGGMVIWGTLLQRRVPAHLLGRVSSLDFFVSLAFAPVSLALAGPVGELVGPALTFTLAGLVPVALAAAGALVWRLSADELAHPLHEPAPAPAATAE